MADDTKGNTHNDIDYTERAYSTSELATMLDIAVPTVRKYAQSLESKGYVFLRAKGTGKHQARLYLENDVTALRYLKEIRTKSNMKVEEATNIVISKFGKGAIQNVRGNDTGEIQRYKEQYSNVDIVELIKQQNELIRGLNERLDKQEEYMKNQQHYIDERLEKRDQMLLETMNKQQENKKGFFAKLFGKNN